MRSELFIDRFTGYMTWLFPTNYGYFTDEYGDRWIVSHQTRWAERFRRRDVRR